VKASNQVKTLWRLHGAGKSLKAWVRAGIPFHDGAANYGEAWLANKKGTRKTPAPKKVAAEPLKSKKR